MTATHAIVIVPGWRDSGPGHWQSLWADGLPGAVRVNQDDWISPLRRAWVDSISQTIEAQTLPVVVVASNNDPYCPVRTAGAYARAWGSEFVRLQNAGHINLEAGFGPWPLGLGLLQSLLTDSESLPHAIDTLVGHVPSQHAGTPSSSSTSHLS